MPIDDIKRRGGFGLERFENEDFLSKVQNNFKNFIALPFWIVVDASLSPDQVEQSIQDLVKTRQLNDLNTEEIKENLFENAL